MIWDFLLFLNAASYVQHFPLRILIEEEEEEEEEGGMYIHSCEAVHLDCWTRQKKKTVLRSW